LIRSSSASESYSGSAGTRKCFGQICADRFGSRRMADIFRVLPAREEYADYYQAIPDPESLDHIAVSDREFERSQANEPV